METIRGMADEVAQLMAARFGGARRGEAVDLATMIRRRGGALPRRLRREARVLACADGLADTPKLSKQADLPRVQSAHKALTSYLRRLGGGMGRSAVGIAASIAFGLLVLGIVAVWIMVRRGLV